MFVAGAALAALIAGGLALLLWPAQPLTAAEQQLVGMWTLPIGPNPPPNVVRQLFWLQADRTLKVGHAPVNSNVKTLGMTGTWRLDGEHLVLNAHGSQAPGQVLGRLFARAPNPPEMSTRWHILRHEGGVVVIEDADGGEATLLRFSE